MFSDKEGNDVLTDDLINKMFYIGAIFKFDYVFISDKIENYNTLTKFCDKLYECQDELAGFKLSTKNFPMGVLTNFFYNMLKDVEESN